MSVVSERSHRRSKSSHRGSHRPGFGGSRSVVDYDGGYEQRPFLMPQFSVAASEGVKMDVRDADWAENTTVMTGNTSEHSFNGFTEQYHIQPPKGRTAVRRCSQICRLCTAFLLAVFSLISGPLMAFGPFIMRHFGYEWPPIQCEVDCQVGLLALGTFSVLLVVAFWPVYWQRSRQLLPRLNFNHTVLAVFNVFILFAFWLFYIVRILLERYTNYLSIVLVANIHVVCLLVIHMFWMGVDVKRSQPVYTLSIVRDPDGECHTFQIGQMTLQEAAVYVLRVYYSHFSTYNPHLDRQRHMEGGGRYRAGGGGNSAVNVGAGFKFYDIEGNGQGALSQAEARMLVAAAARRRIAGHNDLFYDEIDFEKRLKKRKYRLISCTEDTFAHVQVNTNNTSYKVEPMNPASTAAVVMHGISKPLQRYLKFTKQREYHPPESVGPYLEKCLQYQFSARTFLQRFFSNRAPVLKQCGEAKWSISCFDPSAQLCHGASFVLISHNKESDGGVRLLCEFSEYPFFNITEQDVPSEKSSYTLKVNHQELPI